MFFKLLELPELLFYISPKIMFSQLIYSVNYLVSEESVCKSPFKTNYKAQF